MLTNEVEFSIDVLDVVNVKAPLIIKYENDISVCTITSNALAYYETY